MNKDLKASLNELTQPELTEVIAYAKTRRLEVRDANREQARALREQLAELKEVRAPRGSRQAAAEGEEKPRKKGKKIKKNKGE
jgi:hypothetical protein